MRRLRNAADLTQDTGSESVHCSKKSAHDERNKSQTTGCDLGDEVRVSDGAQTAAAQRNGSERTAMSLSLWPEEKRWLKSEAARMGCTVAAMIRGWMAEHGYERDEK